LRQVISMILAGGQGTGLGVLTRHRPASAMPFGGKYRVIDFCLSNCSNSEINQVAVLTQYAPGSLNEHIGTGATWDLDRRDGGVRLLHPYGRRGGSSWYQGPGDAIAQNLNVLQDWGARWVVVASGDQVYKMDYSELVRAHQASGAPATMTVKPVPLWDARRFGIVTVDDGRRVVDVEEKPVEPRGNLANLGIYVFDARLLFERLRPGVEVRDIVLDMIRPLLADRVPVHAMQYDGYWDDIGTVDSYFRANMELLAPRARLILADPDWRIYTPSEERPPVKLVRGAAVSRSMVANGAVVRGRVCDSILFPGAVVEHGASVTSSILFQDTVVRAGAQVDLAIIDKHVTVGEGAVVGHGESAVGPEGPAGSSVVTVGKSAVIPARARIGRRSVIEVGAREGDFPAADVAPGSYVGASRPDPRPVPAGALGGRR
jgi:glucose-1-phosphate adenylyltransferase